MAKRMSGGEPEDEIVVGAGGGAPAFESSWGAAAATPLAVLGPLRFYRHGGRTHIAGALKGGTPGPTSVAFTLPAGYDPAYLVLDDGAVSYSDDMTTAGTATAVVNNAGELVIGAASEANVFVHLDFRHV